MAYPNHEQETTCSFDYITKEWSVYSCVRRHMTKLSRIAEPYWKEEEPDSKGEMRMIAGKWNLKMSQVRFAKMIAKADETDEENEVMESEEELEEVI